MTEFTVLKREGEAAKKFHICLNEFTNPENRMVRNYCHYTGLFRGAAQKDCNLKYPVPDHIPTGFHNLIGCDCHLFIKDNMNKDKCNKGNIGVKDKYISFDVNINNVKLTRMSNKDGKEVRKNIQLSF